MPAPKNPFKAALREDRFQLGLWVALASPYAAEVVSGSGYDWLLIDGEHGPNDIPLLAAQIHSLAGSGSHPIVRLPIGEAWLIKQILDAGAQTLLIPMVESVEQAQALVRAVRYPPHGIRGVGAALGRASQFSRIGDYLETANDEICLLLQIESRAGLAVIDEVAALDGVDGVFIGPSDLAADMGHLGKAGFARSARCDHPRVRAHQACRKSPGHHDARSQSGPHLSRAGRDLHGHRYRCHAPGQRNDTVARGVSRWRNQG